MNVKENNKIEEIFNELAEVTKKLEYIDIENTSMEDQLLYIVASRKYYKAIQEFVDVCKILILNDAMRKANEQDK